MVVRASILLRRLFPMWYIGVPGDCANMSSYVKSSASSDQRGSRSIESGTIVPNGERLLPLDINGSHHMASRMCPVKVTLSTSFLGIVNDIARLASIVCPFYGDMTLCMVALAVATSFPYDNYGASIAAAFFMYLFYFFIPIDFRRADFLYSTEGAPIRLRVAMASISTANY
jgi:hypothetical protein